MIPKKSLIKFILVTVIAVLAGCTTTGPLIYGPSNNGAAGYFERQRDVYKWMVGAYYSLNHQTPQQAANIVMRRAAEIAAQDGFKWMRILNYDTEQRRGPIGSLPASIDMKSGSIYRGMDFHGNQDARVSDSQFRLGVNDALIEYMEFSRKIDCQSEKCGTMDSFIEKCSDGWDGGTQELSSMCNKIAVSMDNGYQEKCIDRVKFITKDFCNTIHNAAYNIRGMVEERNLGGVGAWYRVDDILQKYSARSEKWASAQRKR